MIEVGTLQSGGVNGRAEDDVSERREMQYTVERGAWYGDGREATWRVRRDGLVIGVVYAAAAKNQFEAIEMPDAELIGWYDSVAAACEGLVDYYELMAGEIEL